MEEADREGWNALPDDIESQRDKVAGAEACHINSISVDGPLFTYHLGRSSVQIEHAARKV